MVPKAEKEPADKKPAAVEKAPVSDKAPAEKKLKAGKKLPKKDKKKKWVKKSVETFKIYIFKVLKQVHPGIEISSKAMENMNNLTDIFEKLDPK